MAPKRKTKSNQKKSKTSAAVNKRMKKTATKKPAVKMEAPKKLAKRKKGQEKVTVTTNASRKKPVVRAEREIAEQIQGKNRPVYAVASARTKPGAFSGRQSGDLQGLSRAEQADSESVDELVEEGNSFEANAITGVEDADNADEKEVRTHEVLEDDVPDQYFDKD